MVKGTSRRVVIVRSPKPEVFDEAIFILRDGAGGRGVTADDLLSEALRTAEEYAFSEGHKKRSFLYRLPPVLLLAAGAVFAGIIELVLSFIL